MPFATVIVGGPGLELDACFYHDEERRPEAQSITWESLDPSIAAVFPVRGPYTFVKGVRSGKTSVRAVVTGVTLYASVTVCADDQHCPE